MASNATTLLSGRSSVENSQDVSPVIHASFHKYALHELDSDLVSNILAAKGSKDPIQESYVEALESVKNDYSRAVTTISQLERHIMQAQTRVVSASEKTLLSQRMTPEVVESKIKSSLRDCLDPELLYTNQLISPKDFFQPPPVISVAPKAAGMPNYLKSLARGEPAKDEQKSVVIAWAEEGVDIGEHISCDSGSLDNSPRGNRKGQSKGSGPRPEEFWKDHVPVGKRNEERAQLDLLVRMTEGKKNPRFVKSSEAGRSRSLVVPAYKPFDPLHQPPIFVVTPNVVLFSKYEPGKVYESTLELRNVSAICQTCRVTPPKSGFFGMNFGEFPTESSLIAPGIACIYKIRFLPDALCEFEDSITIYIPDREPLVIPLIGKRPPPVLTLPPAIDVGECLLAGTKVCTVKLKNLGGEGKFCVLPKSSWPCASLKQAVGFTPQRNIDIGSGFSIYPGTFRLKKKEEIALQIIFSPSEIRRHTAEFVIVCDNCQVQFHSVCGEATRIHFDIPYVDGGLYSPLPSDYVDAFAASHIAFPMLNLGMAFDKKLCIRNNRKMDIPFVWAIVKPHLIAPLPPVEELSGEPSGQVPKIPDCRIIEEQSTFSIEPPTGMFLAGQVAEFVLSYLPDKVGFSHSALHLIIPGVPQPSTPPDRERVSRENSSIDLPSRSSKSQQSVTVADVTALEIDLRGSCEHYSLTLSPCAIFLDGLSLIRTSSRHNFFLRNDSRGPAAFEWQPIADDDVIIEVEPKIGVLEPGATAPLTAIVTGTKSGHVVKQVPCWIEFCPEAICLQLEANFKGPECIFCDVGKNSQKMLAFVDFGLVRITTVPKIQFFIANTSGIDASWSLSFVSSLNETELREEDLEFETERPVLTAEDLTISATSGVLQPLESQKIEVKLTLSDPEYRLLGPRTGFIKLDVANGKSRILQLFADIQNPDVCLASSELVFPDKIFIDTVAKEAVFLLNKTNLTTEYVWDVTNVKYSENSTCNNCEFTLEPLSGTIGPKERLPIMLTVKPLKRGKLEAFVTCSLPEISDSLVFLIRGEATGLDVDYSVFEIPNSGGPVRTLESVDCKCAIAFDKFKLGDVVRRQLVIRNKTLIPANYQLTISKFKPPNELMKSSLETEIRRQLMSSDPKTVAEIRNKLLSNGLGLAIVAVPSTGHLTAEGTCVVEVFAVADMWGEYFDEIVSKVGDLEPEGLKISAEAVGSPLLFQMMVAQRQKTACCRFGVAVQGTAPITKKLRLLNEGPCDVRLDWRLYEVRAGDTQLVDLIYYMLDPFPEIKPVNSPQKHSRSGATQQRPTNGEERLSTGSTQVAASEAGEAPCEEEKNLISVVVRKHEGVSAEAKGVFLISPSQIVVKGRSHATVEVTLDPRQIPALPTDEKFLNVEAFGLAYVSLAENVRQPADGSVKRVRWFDAETVRLGITAQIQPALLAMESVDEDLLAMLLPASHIVPKSLYADIEAQTAASKSTKPGTGDSRGTPPMSPTSDFAYEQRNILTSYSLFGSEKSGMSSQLKIPVRQPITLRFYNYHETELRLTAEIASPFKLVYFGTASRDALIDKPTNKTAETSLPAHDTLILRIDVDTGMSMISDLDSLVPNLAVVDGRFLTMSSESLNRSVHYRRFLTIKYSNDTSQSVRLSCTIPLPLVSVNTTRMEFPITLIGKSRELFFDAINASESDTWLQCHVETESDADRGCFRVRPFGCRVGPTGGRRVPISIIFCPRHEGLHTARVQISEKIMGQRFTVELEGLASLDERHGL